MKLSWIAPMTLLAPLCLANSATASNFTSPKQLSTQSRLIAQSNWKQVSSSTGKFTVNMPGKPTENTEKDEDGLTSKSFTLSSDSGYYSVIYLDFSEIGEINSAQAKQFLDMVPSKFSEGAGAKLLNHRSITLTGYQGKEFTFAINPKMRGKGRAYFANNKLYILMAIAPETASFNTFLNSFRFLA
ncbi:MAG: hypothetical protein WBB28_29025 [Crinalium sp.]